MKYTRKIAVFLLISTAFIFVSCGSEDSSAPATTKQQASDTTRLKEMSDTVTKKMRNIASDENYQTLISTSDDLKKILKEWSGYSPDSSADILVIPVTEKLIPSYEIPDSGLDSLSDSTRDYVIRIMASSIASRMNSTYAGTEAIAASAVAQYSETFRIDTETFQNQIWIIPCTDTVGITVSFNGTGDQVVTVCASYCTLPEPESREGMLSVLFGASCYDEIGAYYLSL